MKIDYSPMNEEQIKEIRNIIDNAKSFVAFVEGRLAKCPGLKEKCFRIDVSIDPHFERIGNQIEIKRKIVKDGSIDDEQYYIQKGFGENDKGWERQSVLCTEEFSNALECKTDGEGTGEGTGQ